MSKPYHFLQSVQQKLSERYSFSNTTPIIHSIPGGSINDAYYIQHDKHEFFCKVNSAVKFPQLFQKEMTGLALLGDQHVIRVPEVIDCFETGDLQVLLLEWIKEGNRSENFWRSFGKQLSLLHQCTGPHFGAHENNYMGSVEQKNNASHSWSFFFEHQRLRPLVLQCSNKKLLTVQHQQAFEILYSLLPGIFDSSDRPVLVHGDLWNGNYMCAEDEQPVLIDAAVYYGHPSVDLGMTQLFGGFPPVFYEAYQFHASFPSNFKEQWQVCNLYPLLIHLFLFGSFYLPQIEKIIYRFTK